MKVEDIRNRQNDNGKKGGNEIWNRELGEEQLGLAV
jgi:hypothetical protein